MINEVSTWQSPHECYSHAPAAKAHHILGPEVELLQRVYFLSNVLRHIGVTGSHKVQDFGWLEVDSLDLLDYLICVILLLSLLLQKLLELFVLFSPLLGSLPLFPIEFNERVFDVLLQ